MEPKQKWSEAERFVWEKTRAGEEADLNSRENKCLDPKSPDGWGESRRISSEFLETILFEKPFREAVTRKGVRIIGACFPEKVDLENVYLPWPLWLSRPRFEKKLNMVGLRADKPILLQGSFVEVDLRGARIKDNLVMKDATVTGKLDMVSASIGGNLLMNDATFKEVNLRGAQIKGQLAMNGATVTGKLDMDSASIGSALLMNYAKFAEVDLRGAQIKGQLAMRGATVKDKLIMISASIGSTLLMDGATFANVNLGFATVGSILDLTGGTFKTLDLTGATVAGDLRLIPGKKSVTWLPDDGAQPNEVQLNLRNTQVDTLIDSPESWPKKIDLRGFTYRQLGGAEQEDEPSERLADVFIKWLGRNKTFSFQPYQRLATVLRNAGKSSTADAILFAARKHERRNTEVWGKWLWLSVLQYVIGYGIGRYTFLALGWAIFVVIVGWSVLICTGEGQKHEKTVTVGEEGTVGEIGFWFSLDYLLPAVRLREAHYTKVDLSHGVRIYFYVHQLIGYILVFFLIAALTGITQPSNGRGPPG